MKLRVLIFGVTGMLGHCAFKNLSKYIENIEVIGIIRSNKDKSKFLLRDGHTIKIFQDFKNPVKLSKLIKSCKPNVIFNFLGLIKQKKKISNDEFIYFNSFFPKLLESICRDKIKIINISTDCVFNGKKGNYDEKSTDFALDIYGLTKYLGEIYSYNNLTIRTSIIGHEIKNYFSLLEWFLRNKKKNIYGYDNVFFSGLTTFELIKVLSQIINKHFNLNGVYHISSSRISKYDLLKKINDIYLLNKNLLPKNDIFIDRSLNSNKFKKLTNIQISTWSNMIEEMKNDNS